MHTVKILPSELSFSVNENETVLQAALRQGFKFPYACDNGACYACEGKLIAGKIKFRNSGQIISTPVSENESKFVKTLFCMAVPQTNLVIEVKKLLAPNEMPLRKAACQIKSVTPLSRDVKIVKLLLPAGKKFDYLPGQYLEATLPKNGKCAFSIANAPGSREIELHIRHLADGASSDELDNWLQNESILKIELPKGDCILKPVNDNTLIFLAGSTGFAPFKAMFEHAFNTGRNQKMILYWGGRSVNDLYLHELLLDWDKKYSHFDYIPVISEPDTQTQWSGRTGLVHLAVLDDFKDFSQGIEVYAGGSPGMVYAALDAFKEKGLPEDHIYSDVFSYAPRE